MGERKRKGERDRDREKEGDNPSTQTIINLKLMFSVEKSPNWLKSTNSIFLSIHCNFERLEQIILYNLSIKAPQHFV